MKVFFDNQAFGLQQYGGISRYFCELITGINNIGQDNAHLSLLWSNNVHLKEYNIPILSYPFPTRNRLLAKSNNIYNIIDSKIGNYDIYHATYFDDFLEQYIGPKPFITTFYDMTYERLSHQFVELSNDKYIISQKKKIAKCASHLIAISENTKQDMVEILGIAPERITVIYLGSPLIQAAYNVDTSISKINYPYLLYVGNRSGYKNFIPFLRSIANVLMRHQIRLVCAGGGSFTSEEQIIIQNLCLNELVKHQAINDTILQGLYKGATAFVFPSLYEGFGIPVLEAFSCNCPCIVSNTSSLPEVAGDAALYIDPTDQESMATAVENVILDNEVRKSLVQRGRQQLAHFSWQRTVRETLDLYKKLT